jgi:TPR repeat protein
MHPDVKELLISRFWSWICVISIGGKNETLFSKYIDKIYAFMSDEDEKRTLYHFLNWKKGEWAAQHQNSETFHRVKEQNYENYEFCYKRKSPNPKALWFRGILGRHFDFFKRAASYGFSEAFANLAWMEKNPFKKTELLHKAIELGSIAAITYLAWVYMDGKGVTKDETEAFKLYKKAADLGCIHSQSMTSYCYRKGIGTEQNLGLADHYSVLAIAQRNKQDRGDQWLYIFI